MPFEYPAEDSADGNSRKAPKSGTKKNADAPYWYIREKICIPQQETQYGSTYNQ